MKTSRKNPPVSDDVLAKLIMGTIFIDVLGVLLIVKAPQSQNQTTFFLLTFVYALVMGGANILWVLFTLRKK